MVMDQNDFKNILGSIEQGLDALIEHSVNKAVANKAKKMKSDLDEIKKEKWF